MNKRSLIAGGLIFLIFVVASTFFVVRWNNPDPDDGPDARNANRDAELENEFVPATLLPLDVEKIEVAADASEDDIQATAQASEKVKEQIDGKTVRKIICVNKGGTVKLVNIVAN